MKKLVVILLVLSSVTEMKAQDSTSTQGTIYFMRSTGFNGSAVAFTVFMDDVILCRINNKRFSMHNVAPGKHSFSSQFAGKKSKEKAEKIEIDVEAGKTYYIQLIFQGGAFVNNLYCQEVTENSAKKVLPTLQQDKKCD